MDQTPSQQCGHNTYSQVGPNAVHNVSEHADKVNPSGHGLVPGGTHNNTGLRLSQLGLRWTVSQDGQQFPPVSIKKESVVADNMELSVAFEKNALSENNPAVKTEVDEKLSGSSENELLRSVSDSEEIIHLPFKSTDQLIPCSPHLQLTDPISESIVDLSRTNSDQHHTGSAPSPFVITHSVYSDSSDTEIDEELGKLYPVATNGTRTFIKLEQKAESSATEKCPSQPPFNQSDVQTKKMNSDNNEKKSGRQTRKRPLKANTTKSHRHASCVVQTTKPGDRKLDRKTCPVCEKKFTRPESLTIHMRVHTGDRPYKCQQCDASYKIGGHLRDHIRSKHSTARPYVCTVCGKDFSYPTARRRHEKACGKQLEERVAFHCSVCEKGFVTAKGFSNHQETCGSTVQGEKAVKVKEVPFKCHDCHKAFPTLQGLERHQRFICGKVSPKDVMFTCQDCGKTYSKRDRFLSHRRHHSGERPYQCTLCDMRFFDQGALKKHVNRHEENRRHKCSLCELSFYKKQALSVHVMRAHCGLKPFKCTECDADLSSAYQLSRHIRNIHRQERRFTCTLCGKGFFDAKPYKKHMIRHTLAVTNPSALEPPKPKKHTCNECGQSFYWRALCAHVASDHPEKELNDVLTIEVLKCNHCPREFSCQQTLNVHKKSHTCVKRYKCDKCDRQFTCVSALRFHSTKHSQERSHCCQECGKTFRWQSNLYYHRMTHHTPKPDYADVAIEMYVCNECGREFRRENFLYLHLKLKNQGLGTPCICSQCGRGFTSAERFESHMSTHGTELSKPFICHICGAGFYYQHVLDRHHKSRHAEKIKGSWLCEECGKYFSRKDYLQKHVARHAKYPQGKIPPAGRPRKDSRSPDYDKPYYSPIYISDDETENCAPQTEPNKEVGCARTPMCDPPSGHNQSQEDIREEASPSSEELTNVNLCDLHNFQSYFNTFIQHTLQ